MAPESDLLRTRAPNLPEEQICEVEPSMTTELMTAQYFSADHEQELGQLQEPRKKGGWNRYLTAICILFALSSVLGALSAARGAYGLAQPVPELEVARTAADRELQKIEQSRINAINKYFPLLVYNELFKLVLAGALMFAAVYMISQNPKARSFALGVCYLALFFHVSTLVVSILMICETGSVVNSMLADSMSRVSAFSETEKEKAFNVVQNYMLTFITIAIAIVFLVKLIYYGVIMAYLWSDEVKKIFGEDPLQYIETEAAEVAASTGVPTTA